MRATTPAVIITLETICTLADEARVPAASIPDFRVNANIIKATPNAISSAIMVSVGRCHCPSTTESATRNDNAAASIAAAARQTRGTEHSSTTPAAQAIIVWPEGAELLWLASELMRTGLGNVDFSTPGSTAHKATTTTICPISHHLLRTTATTRAIIASTPTTTGTAYVEVNKLIAGANHAGTALWK
jgi:hypothetical protein